MPANENMYASPSVTEIAGPQVPEAATVVAGAVAVMVDVMVVVTVVDVSVIVRVFLAVAHR